MNTASTQTRQRAPGHRSLPLVSTDTRLALAHIFMDVVLGGDPALREARKAAAEAIAEAGRYSAEASRLEDRVRGPQTPQPDPVLKQAGDLIRERGWVQGAWTDGHGAVCALHAIRLAAGGNEQAEADAVAVLLGRISLEPGSNGLSLPGWNDRRDRTQADVLRLLW